jgi:hypothetical protein
MLTTFAPASTAVCVGDPDAQQVGAGRDTGGIGRAPGGKRGHGGAMAGFATVARDQPEADVEGAEPVGRERDVAAHPGIENGNRDPAAPLGVIFTPRIRPEVVERAIAERHLVDGGTVLARGDGRDSHEVVAGNVRVVPRVGQEVVVERRKPVVTHANRAQPGQLAENCQAGLGGAIEEGLERGLILEGQQGFPRASFAAAEKRIEVREQVEVVRAGRDGGGRWKFSLHRRGSGSSLRRGIGWAVRPEQPSQGGGQGEAGKEPGGG